MLTTLLAAAVLATKFGVHFSGDGPLHDHPEFVTDAGASWVRLNLNLNPNDYTPSDDGRALAFQLRFLAWGPE